MTNTLRQKAESIWDLVGKDIPEPAWLIPDWLPQVDEGVNVLITGAPKAGKSIIALELAFTLAASNYVKFLNSSSVQNSGPTNVLYINEENTRNSIRREVFNKMKDLPLGEVTLGAQHEDELGEKPSTDLISLIDHSVLAHNAPATVRLGQFTSLNRTGVRLLESETVKELIGFIQEEQFGAVVFDSLYKFFPGSDINHPRDASMVLNVFDRIRNETEATIILLHHASAKGGKGDLDARVIGSTFLPGWYDAHIGITHSADNIEKTRTVERKFREHEPTRDKVWVPYAAGGEWGQFRVDYKQPDSVTTEKKVGRHERLYELIGPNGPLREEAEASASKLANKLAEDGDWDVSANTLRSDIGKILKWA